MAKLYLGANKIFDSTETAEQIANKVDKVSGKQLSTEDYTTADKNAVSSMSSHLSNTSNPHQVTKSLIDLGNVTNDALVKRTEMGVASGVATLDSSGKIPSSQLPSYVDDVLEYSAKSSFPTTGETGKIYVDTSTNLTYRWGGSSYVEISASIALGETSSTAYAGDKGKAVTDALSSHTTNKNNPHSVTKAQVGLGNVDNTSDANKPISTATQTALDTKLAYSVVTDSEYSSVTKDANTLYIVL